MSCQLCPQLSGHVAASMHAHVGKHHKPRLAGKSVLCQPQVCELQTASGLWLNIEACEQQMSPDAGPDIHGRHEATKALWGAEWVVGRASPPHILCIQLGVSLLLGAGVVHGQDLDLQVVDELGLQPQDVPGHALDGAPADIEVPASPQHPPGSSPPRTCPPCMEGNLAALHAAGVQG